MHISTFCTIKTNQFTSLTSKSRCRFNYFYFTTIFKYNFIKRMIISAVTVLIAIIVFFYGVEKADSITYDNNYVGKQVYNNLNNGTWILHESKIVII